MSTPITRDGLLLFFEFNVKTFAIKSDQQTAQAGAPLPKTPLKEIIRLHGGYVLR